MRSHAVRVGMVVGILAVSPSLFAKGYKIGGSRKPAQSQQQQQPQPQVQPKPAQPQVNQNAETKARQDIAAATEELNKATVALNGMTAKYRHEKLEPTTPYKEAQAAVTKAQLAYDDAKHQVIEKLKKDPEYQKLVDERVKVQKEHDALTADSSFEDRTRIAKAMMSGSDAISKMEAGALASDQKTTQAKATLDGANAKLADVVAKFDATLKDIPEWATASKAVEDAKQKLETAKSALAAAQQQNQGTVTR